jgi:hypothetical protein
LGGTPELRSSENESFGGSEAVVSIRFEHNGCFGEVKVSWLSKLQNNYRIVGELGAVESGIEDWWVVNVTAKSGKTKKIKLKCKEKHYNDFANKIVSNFIDVVSESGEPLIPANEVIPSIELIEECYRTASRFRLPWYETLGVLDGK